MRKQSKPNTGKPGISAANCYRSNIKSPATDLEALVDGYDLETLFKAMRFIHNQISEHGICDHNRELNAMLNSTPLPAIYRPIKPKRRRVVA